MLKSCVFCFVLLTSCSTVRHVPFSPCPRLFNYFESTYTFEVFGALTFDNDLTGRYDLEVNMSIPLVTDKNIFITRTTAEYGIQNGEPIEYYVHFPYNHTFPKLTSITFNGELYCVGRPAEVTVDHGVTPLSAKYFFTTKIIDFLKKTSTSRPFIQIDINNDIPNDPECGKNIDFKGLVIGGKYIRSGEYPWLVAIFTSTGAKSHNFICGGNLISTKHVITAAHCMRDIQGSNVPFKDLVLVLGKHNINNWINESTIRRVKDYYVHPDYEKPSDADIAVLLLDEPVTFNLTIKPICLWNEHEDLVGIVNRTGNVAGWGKDETGQNYVDEPKQVELPIVSEEICLRADSRFLTLTSSRTFCAGKIKKSKGPCTGDSGSGFVMKRGGTWKLRGIVSAALSDPETYQCDVDNYIVFTDVPKYTEWVVKIMKMS